MLLASRQAFVVAVVLASLSGGSALALEWQSDFAAAQKLAAQSNRLLLVHFGAPWCQPCMRLERQVFNQPGFGQGLETSFVPVKLNYDEQRELAHQLGVEAIPIDVIMTPQGQVIQRIQSPPTGDAYVATMQRIAEYAAVANHTPPAAAAATTVAAVAVGSVPTGAMEQQVPPQQAMLQQTMQQQPIPQQQIAAQQVAAQQITGQPASPVGDRYASMAASPAVPAQPAGPPPAAQAAASAAAPTHPASQAQLPPNSPSLGLEGFCPVMLVEQRKWVAGDVLWGAIHHGRTYLFASAEAQQRFLANPERYSPVQSGYDPVLALDEGQSVSGDRRYGVFFADHIYLFRDEESLKRFSQNPNRYAAEIMQAMRQSP
ncbi:MAG TPA: thioredoxin family protein [Pirellulales bacterium]|jgi:thioredoxin-like negative regulator of GroEL/YHS domain-containing protein|nr:thioredoxin family protein [Pirellulales bacterium]